MYIVEDQNSFKHLQSRLWCLLPKKYCKLRILWFVPRLWCFSSLFRYMPSLTGLTLRQTHTAVSCTWCGTRQHPSSLQTTRHPEFRTLHTPCSVYFPSYFICVYCYFLYCQVYPAEFNLINFSPEKIYTTQAWNKQKVK